MGNDRLTMTIAKLSESDAYRVGQLTERLQSLRERAAAVALEQHQILARYGIGPDRPVEVVTEPGLHPIGLVLDAVKRTPLEITENESTD